MLDFPHHSREHLFSSTIQNVSVLGTVHHHRNRWNPFSNDNAMERAGKGVTWMRWFTLYPNGGRHGDGIYTIRFILNHNSRRALKLKKWRSEDFDSDASSSSWSQISACLKEDALGRASENLSFRVHKACSVCIHVDPVGHTAILSSENVLALSPVHAETSFELNGFVWDELDAFGKFNEREHGRGFQKIGHDHWQLALPLRSDGGIDFRHDGVYQFLISRNGDEDQGFAAVNSSESQDSLELVAGSGFGSSHGTSLHSAPTLKVSRDGVHIFNLYKQHHNYRLSVQGPGGVPVKFCNHEAHSIQLLGTVFKENSFDPNQTQSQMKTAEGGHRFVHELTLEEGVYSINFAIGSELFLDTMGLGCWLQNDGPGLRGIAWHGKPNEVNILFQVNRSGLYSFHYDRRTDEFGIDPVTLTGPHVAKPLEAVRGINTLSLVGNFEPPLDSWQPDSDANLMSDLGGLRFERLVDLNRDVTYQFKFVANRTNWLLVFADYEFDGFGMSYDPPVNSKPFDSSLAALKRHGHLTTHGNPPAISFQPSQSGWHRFAVDLNTGAYAVTPVPR